MLTLIGDYLNRYPRLAWLIHIPACAFFVALENGWLF